MKDNSFMPKTEDMGISSDVSEQASEMEAFFGLTESRGEVWGLDNKERKGTDLIFLGSLTEMAPVSFLLFQQFYENPLSSK